MYTWICEWDARQARGNLFYISSCFVYEMIEWHRKQIINNYLMFL